MAVQMRTASSASAAVGSRAAALPSRLGAPHPLRLTSSSSRRGMLVVRAQQEEGKPPAAPKPKEGVEKAAVAIGLPLEEGLFGFKPFAEKWTGRLAMMGFITSIAQEFGTGQGTLAQIHLMEDGAPDYFVLGLLCAFFGTAMIIGSAQTLNGLREGTLDIKDVLRYRNFLALNKEAENVAEESRKMKEKGDTITPASSSMAATPAPGAEQPAAADGQPAEGAPPMTPQKRKDIMDTYLFSGNSEMRYAQNIELTNGRWAMLGFLSAVLVEAGTGNGIIGQLFGYAKLAGLLGKDSGF